MRGSSSPILPGTGLGPNVSGDPLDIAVVGPGGVGGLFGAHLARAGHNVHFLGRGPHLKAIQENGLKITSPQKDFVVEVDATENVGDIGRCAYVLFCVKSTDTDEAAEMIGPLLGPETAVISFQNGVDNEARIGKIIGADHVLGGAAFVFASIDSPGVIGHAGGVARLVFGELDGTTTPRAQRFLQLCVDADIDCKLSADITGVLWRKYALICAVAGMTAASHMPIGDIRSTTESLQMLREILSEVVQVARARGIDLRDDTVDQHFQFVSGLPENAFSSLHYDFDHGKPTELEALHGNLVRLAEELGVPTPMSRAIYAILKPADLHHATRDRPE